MLSSILYLMCFFNTIVYWNVNLTFYKKVYPLLLHSLLMPYVYLHKLLVFICVILRNLHWTVRKDAKDLLQIYRHVTKFASYNTIQTTCSNGTESTVGDELVNRKPTKDREGRRQWPTEPEAGGGTLQPKEAGNQTALSRRTTIQRNRKQHSFALIDRSSRDTSWVIVITTDQIPHQQVMYHVQYVV